ncbi:RNA polymerase subunit sigma, partial [Pseudomonas sp. SIMBA_064]
MNKAQTLSTRYDPRELSDEELVARSHTELFHVTRAYEELM